MITKINKMKGRKGFTLVELLLVVAILAVLAFLAVPAIAQTIRNARIRTCLSNEEICETGIWRWYADQVALGRTFTIAAQTDEPLGDFVTNFTVTDGGGALAPIIDYFTPSQFRTCPFDESNVYQVTFTASTDGTSLVSVIVDCEGNPH